MSWLHSLILGAVQGLTEFIPISSSAHLFLIPWLMGWGDSGLTFDVALHVGTLFAVIFYYRQEWARLIKIFLKTGFNGQTPEEKMPLYIVLATIPAALAGVFIEKSAETVFRNPILVASMLGIMGILLWYADKKAKKIKSFTQITVKDALIVGVMQSLALIPGTSRSGVTMFAGLLCGFNRTTAAKFSFMLSMPITLGACIFKLRHLNPSQIDIAFLIGVLSSTLFGFLAIGGMIKYLQKRSFGVFALYRIILAITVLLISIYSARP